MQKGTNMTLGQKIKDARISANLTQSELAGKDITRNMISQIESDNANPSLNTLKRIAEKLNLPLSYFFSDDKNAFLLQKEKNIEAIKKLYKEKKYTECIRLTSELSQTDDELALILANCYFELGKINVLTGSLNSAKQSFDKACVYLQKTVYDTSKIKAVIPLYMAVVKNIQAPLLEFESEEYLGIFDDIDYDFYKYVSQDSSHSFKNQIFQKHIRAKELMRNYKYYDAIRLLIEIEEESKAGYYNMYVMYSVYSDLDNCYKQIADFEKAYRYSNKRISLLEGFKS